MTRRVITAGWKQVRGEAPPDGVTDRKVTWRTALTYAVAMGVGVAVAQVIASASVGASMGSRDARGSARLRLTRRSS